MCENGRSYSRPSVLQPLGASLAGEREGAAAGANKYGPPKSATSFLDKVDELGIELWCSMTPAERLSVKVWKVRIYD